MRWHDGTCKRIALATVVGATGVVAMTAGCAAATHSATVYTSDGPVHVTWTPQDVAQERAVRPHAKSETASFAFVRLGRSEKLHRHDLSDVTIVMLRGRARVRIGEREVEMGPGDVAWIPRGIPHSVLNLTDDPIEAFAVFSPGADPKDRIYLE